MSLYYVYIYRDPRDDKDRQPIYVGKGTRNRAWAHTSDWASNKFFRHFLRHLDRHGLKPIVEIYRKFKTEDLALACEKRQIAKFGRRCLGTGPLLNIDEGGTQVPACSKELWLDPEYRAKVSVGLKRAFGTPEARARTSARFKALWEDPEYRAKQTANLIEINSRPEVKQKRSTATKEWWLDPTYRKKARAGVDVFLQTNEYREAKAVETAGYWADPEHRNFRQKAMLTAHARPEEKARKRVVAKRVSNTLEAKARSSKVLQDIWTDPQRKAAQSRAISLGLQAGSDRLRVSRVQASKAHTAKWADPEWRARTVARMREAALNPQRTARCRDALTSEQRSILAKAGWAKRSSQSRTEQALRTWETRRAKAVQLELSHG